MSELAGHLVQIVLLLGLNRPLGVYYIGRIQSEGGHERKTETFKINTVSP